jgi:hypothetical protein
VPRELHIVYALNVVGILALAASRATPPLAVPASLALWVVAFHAPVSVLPPAVWRGALGEEDFRRLVRAWSLGGVPMLFLGFSFATYALPPREGVAVLVGTGLGPSLAIGLARREAARVLRDDWGRGCLGIAGIWGALCDLPAVLSWNTLAQLLYAWAFFAALAPVTRLERGAADRDGAGPTV